MQIADCEIKEKGRIVKIDETKRLVEVKVFKFRGVPTTHIRPIYENINLAIEKWKYNLTQSMSMDITEEKQLDDISNLQNGDLRKLQNCEMEITNMQDDIYRNNINNNIDSEFTSRDYNSKITNNSLSNDKDNSKPTGLEIYNSPVPEKQESHISISLGIKSKQKKETPLKDMPTRAKEIANNLVDDKELSEGVHDCVEYFLEKYKAKNRKEHLPLRNDTLQNVVEVMLSTLTVLHDEDLENIYESEFYPLVSFMSDWEDRKDVIDKYFETDFREKCDYSLVHFTHKDVITHVMQKCYIGNDINWYENIPC